ncbi:efflux RND transporter periplasmic adaptor subunit [Arsukibacterium sp.]|uniref:efflux RND transporter periplasmic adaptor subunit n=1 Tax=Arsukibacterium sp. TaxID=1977258 RepID=UPI00299EC485|nr:efflux RND transporter periplasmic adaptor subunit [Arsukibacterium sp.]MDX1536875.1 efflux RND transporter periplasmic adaptor subunit [Arsukibacterium sp.]
MLSLPVNKHCNLSSVSRYLAFIVTLAWLTACDKPPPQAESAPLPLVETATATPHGEDYTIVVNGFVRAPEQVSLVTEVAGVVATKSAQLEVGQYFEQGEELFRLEQTDYQAQLLQAQAELDNAEVARTTASDDLQRIQSLFQRDLAAQARLDDSRLALTTAEARLKKARAAVQLAEEALADTVITAPFAALIASENVSVGAYFSPAQPALTLISANQLEVEAGLTPEQSAAVARRLDAKSDTAITVVASDKQLTLNASLRSVSPLLDRTSRTISHTVLLSQPANKAGAALTVGEYVQVHFAARAGQPLMRVPAASVRQNSHVYLLDKDNKLQKIEVTPVAYQQQEVLITEDTRLLDARLLLTSLVNEATGLKVRTRED